MTWLVRASHKRKAVSKGDTVKKTRVLLADDNPAILQHAAHLLAQHFEVVGAVPDGESVLQAYEKLKPDVVILDISMGELSGIQVAQRLRDLGHQTKVIFLTVHEEQEYVCEAFGSGAWGYVIKSCLADLPVAMHAVMADHIFISPNLLHSCQECYRQPV